MSEVKIDVPLNDDLLFKEVLCHKDNREQLIYFLKTMTNIDEKIIRKNLEVKYESILDKTRLEDKNLRGDVIIKFDNYYINLENYSYFDKNSLAKSTSYIMRIFSTQLERGEKYECLENTIQINIIENDESGMFPEFENEYYLTNSKDINNRILPDKFQIKYYNVDKLKNGPYNKINEIKIKWIKYLCAKDSEERKEIAKGDRLLMELDNWVDKYINDEKTKELYGKWGEKIALEKGIKQGEKKKTLEIAKMLKEEGFELEQIQKITKLSLEEIKKIS